MPRADQWSANRINLEADHIALCEEKVEAFLSRFACKTFDPEIHHLFDRLGVELSVLHRIRIRDLYNLAGKWTRD